MNLQLPRRLLVAALFAAGAMSSAQAVNYVEIEGANLKFYYDADFWGLNSASVAGNSISFDTSERFHVSAENDAIFGGATNTRFDYGYWSVIAVPKSGYSVALQLSASATSSYAFTGTGTGTSSSSIIGSISSGVYAGGGFTSPGFNAVFYQEGLVNSDLTPGSGTKVISTTVGNPASYFTAVALDTGMNIGASQFGKGHAETTLTDVTYGFTVTAVPEPETYAMMIAGLGLVGFAARRRKHAA
ncbi:PEPxxWA-CTERM sorting domain-containing protein [Duganella rivi]|nr:PEPxxWA-CTERM sorting domain-containing protein [Duganella rivi]